MIDNGENQVGPEPSWLDDVLRSALTEIPQEQTDIGSAPAEMASEIARAIEEGWPHGRPPTLDELADDADDAGEVREGHWSSDPTHEQSWPDPVIDEDPGQGHLHGWHRHDDHSADTDPEHGAAL
jgi:hypothetical protein